MVRLWRYGKRISESYARHQGDLMAAALSFYALFSLIPLLLMAIAMLGGFVGSSAEARQQVKNVIQPYLPMSDSLIFDALAEIERGKGLLGLCGLIGLLVSASAIFTKLEIAFNTIWGVRTMRGWWQQRLAALGTALLTLTLLFSTIVLTSLLTFAQTVRVPGLDMRAGQIPLLWQVLGYLIPPLLSVLMFAVTYKIIPNRAIPWREAFAGGLFAGIAWELAKHLFTLYLAHFANYDRTYGSLGGVVILLMWIYYSAMILLFGAEIAADSLRRD